MEKYMWISQMIVHMLYLMRKLIKS